MSDLTSRIAGLSPEKRAILERRLKEASAGGRSSGAPLAIVGIGCRLPGGVDGPEAFWQLLASGGDAITEIPADRWSVDEYYSADPSAAGKIATRWGGFLDGIDRFDAAFFGISPREASQMDPQQRLLLEVAWQALEHAGQAPDKLARSRTGVFIGAHSQSNDYCWLQFERPDALDGFSGTGSAHNFLSGRLSYLLDLQGPSLVVDTACSSSLAAVHLACQSLRADECTLAIAGGVNVILTPHFTVAASRMRMLASDGRCKPFDASADGFTRGEGCGIVVIKRLADALAAGDRVLAVVRGSAMNQDGHTNGITAPNGLSQQAVVRDALRSAGVDPADVGYVETHGTGTPLGDPIEVEALAGVLAAGRPAHRPVFLGSAKSNVGHLEGAAGVTGLIKAVLSLQARQVAPVVHFKQLNPHIALDGTPFVIPARLTDWTHDREGQPRIAGVSAFGWSGTNVHVVLEEAPASQPAADAAESRPFLVPLSAGTAESLTALAGEWLATLDGPGRTDASVRAVAAAAGVRRAHREHRLAVVAGSTGDLVSGLRAVVRGEALPGVVLADRPASRSGIVFVFPGQGSQWLGMGRELLAAEPVFREAIERCERAIAAHTDWSLTEQLAAGADRSRLAQIDVVQPALFAIEVALAALWRSWGIEPEAVVGHSMGEVAAAHVAGALSLEDAATVICRRSRLLKRVSGQGAMAVVELSLEEAAVAIAGYESRLSVAVSNSPRSTVLSGDTAALDEVIGALQARDVFCRPVKVDVASHSPQVDPLRPDLLRELAGLRPSAARVPIHSTVTTDVTDGAGFGAEYRARNLREPVRFSTVVQRLARGGAATFIEMSPHPILLPAIESTLQQLGVEGLALPSLRREEPERASLLASLGRLFVAGHDVDWSRQTPGVAPHVPMPCTPLVRERFWLDDGAPAQRTKTQGVRQGHALLGSPIDAPGGGFAWEVTPEGAGLPALDACRLHDRPMLAPGVCIDAALEAARAVGAAAVEGLELLFPLTSPLEGELDVRAEASPEPGGRQGFRMSSRAGDGPRITNLVARLGPAGNGSPAPVDVSSARLRCADALDGDGVYSRLSDGAWHTGPALRALLDVRFGSGEAIARVETGSVRHGERSALDPRLGQACVDVALLAAQRMAGASGGGDLFVPLRIARIERVGEWAGSGWISLRAVDGRDEAIFDADLLDEGGAPVAILRGVELQRRPAEARDIAAAPLDGWLFELGWQPLSAGADADTRQGQAAWVILSDRSGVGERLGAILERRGDRVVTIRREQAADLKAELARGRASAGDRCRGIMHLWSLDLPPLGAAPEAYEREVSANSASVLETVQQLAGGDGSAAPHLWVVTRGAQPAGSPVGPEAPGQAPVWGLGRVVGEEHPECWGGLVDLDPADDADGAAAALVARLGAADGERQVAVRHQQWFGARYQPLRAGVGAKLRLRPDASYLLTGGFGGVGLAAARWLVTRGARHLVLAGRTPLPPRAQWTGVDPASAAGQRIAAVRELEALGASVHVAALDVGDGDALGAFWRQFHQEGWPPVRGIVHAAVVIEDGLLRDLDPGSFATVARPKISGTLALHRLTEDAELDFFALFSSLGSVLGQTGQGNYAAANAFMDALAHYRRGRGQTAISINWGGWREAGLGASSAGARLTISALESEGISSFTTAQGLAVFGRLLEVSAPQAIVMPVSPALFRRSHWATSDPALFSAWLEQAQAAGPVAPTRSQTFRDELLLAEPEARRPMLEQFLAGQLAAVLRLPVARIDPDRPMGALGLESLMALEFRNRLEPKLGLKLSATIVWNHPTVSALARFLGERLEIPFDAAPAPEPEPEPAGVAASDLDEMSELDALKALASGGHRP